MSSLRIKKKGKHLCKGFIWMCLSGKDIGSPTFGHLLSLFQFSSSQYSSTDLNMVCCPRSTSGDRGIPLLYINSPLFARVVSQLPRGREGVGRHWRLLGHAFP